jgi:hypothetical protein
MEKKSKIPALLYGTVFILFSCWLSSCQKTPIDESPQNQNYHPVPVSSATSPGDPNFLSLPEAQKYAELITPEVFRGGENKSIVRDIESSMTLNDRNGIPALYIFNYSYDKGYIVMSADFRYEPICAFVESGNISTIDVIPSTLGSWFGLTLENIGAIRDGWLNERNNESYVPWKLLTGSIYLQHLPFNYPTVVGAISEINCNPYNYYVKEKLVQTRWDQGCTYNNLIPVANCSTMCGRAPTGCVSVAGSQVLRYWAQPNSGFNYNYTSMPNDYGNGEVQRLMLNVGQLVNMDWSCDASGAQTEDLAHVFQYYFYYSAPGEFDDYENSSRWTVKSDIDLNRPVILSGCDDHNDFLWWSYGAGNCHAWICDGYRLSTSNCYTGRFHFHMNWGWGGAHNGYYYQSDEWPSGHVYQYARKFLHNIHP